MRQSKFITGLSAAAVALALASAPAQAQENSNTAEADDAVAVPDQTEEEANFDIALDGEYSDDEKMLTVAGVAGAAAHKVNKRTKVATQILDEIAETRNRKAKLSATAANNANKRAAIGRGSQLDELVRRGKAAKAARQGKATTAAARTASAARPANITKTNLGQVIKNGEAAQRARAAKPAGTAADVLKAREANAKPRNIRTLQASANNRAAIGRGSQLDDLVRRGEAAQNARSTRLAGSADEMAELNRRGNQARTARLKPSTSSPRAGNGMKVTFRDQVKPASKAITPKPGVSPARISAGSQQLGRQIVGNGGDLGKVLSKGDAAQFARGRVANEAQVIRNVAGNGGDISKLNKAGRAAQVSRGVGGVKAASTTADAAKMARTAKMAKTAKNAATVAKVGKGARGALASSGVGLAVIAAEAAGKESVKALTGAEIQDPLSTGFQYGAALFDKDVSLRDVAAQRRAHHAKNFQNIKATFTEKGRLKQNLSNYGAEKAEQFREFGRKTQDFADKVDRTDRTVRAGIEDKTGLKLERRSDVNKRYLEAAASDKPVAAMAEVAKQRTQHHVNNAKAVTGKIGEGTKKVACGVGNLFKKKENKKDCKK